MSELAIAQWIADLSPTAMLGVIMAAMAYGVNRVIRGMSDAMRDNNSVTSSLVELMREDLSVTRDLQGAINNLAAAQTAQTASTSNIHRQDVQARAELASIIEANTSAIRSVSEIVQSHDNNAAGFIAQQTEVTTKMQDQNERIMALLMEIKNKVDHVDEQRAQDAARLQAVIEQLQRVVAELTSLKDDKCEE